MGYSVAVVTKTLYMTSDGRTLAYDRNGQSTHRCYHARHRRSLQDFIDDGAGIATNAIISVDGLGLDHYA